ncbi:MAG: trypsin-like peptidase domain-containing protein, partial [Candidatus Poribacteria bacterium]|nr:trypsin-like peptidase domain-containing protein [Candidatus Poribacteria bacterium]
PKGKFSKGIISGSPPIDGVRFFQFDAPVSPGSSGGPIVNSSGEVVAVIAMKVPKLSETLKYAIPSIYLEKLLAGKGDPRPPKPPPKPPDDGRNPEPKVTPVHKDLLKLGIDFYKAARFREAVEALQSALNWLDKPKVRAQAHLYLGFSKWGLAESKSSVSAEFREALRYNPSIELPPEVGHSHPVFKPLLEQTRDESTGTLTITASPPETEIKIHGGEVQPKLPDGETVRLRLFKGNYAVEGILGHAHKVVPVLIKPGDRQGISLTMSKTPVPEHEFEVTLDLFSTEKPKEVTVHYTIYDANGDELNRGKKEMQLREERAESSTRVYHVKLPAAAQGGKVVYRIEADGRVIRDDPMQVEILEPPENAFIEANQTVPIKARVISNVVVREVRVVYDAPTTLADTSPSQKLEKKSSSNTYIGKIPTERKHTDGATWFYVTAANKDGDQARSATQAVRTTPPEIVVLEPPGAAVLPINKSIEVIAEVKTREPLKEIRVHYDFPRKELSEASPLRCLKRNHRTRTSGRFPRSTTGKRVISGILSR